MRIPSLHRALVSDGWKISEDTLSLLVDHLYDEKGDSRFIRKRVAEERDVLRSHPAGPQRFDPAQDGAGRVVRRGGKLGDRDCARILIETYEIRERASGIDRHPVLPQGRTPARQLSALVSHPDCALRAWWHRLPAVNIQRVMQCIFQRSHEKIGK